MIDKFINSCKDFAANNLPNFIIAIVILVAGYFATKLIIKIAKKAMDRGNIDFSLEKFFLNCIKVACYIILVISALSEIGISTTGIIAFFSAAAAAIALALKDSLSNIASGIILLFSKPFVTGDYIEFGSSQGNVMQIDLIHTKIETVDHKLIVLPNSAISSMEVINYSFMPHRRVDIIVPVGYNEDIENVRRVLFKAVGRQNKIINEPQEPFVKLNSFSPSSLDFTVRVWVNTDDYWEVYHDLRETIKKTLDEENITIPYE